MRSTKKEQARLMREVRTALGVRTNREASEHVLKVEDYFRQSLEPKGYSAVHLSKFYNNSWSLSALLPGPGCGWGCLCIDTSDWMDNPKETTTRFLKGAR